VLEMPPRPAKSQCWKRGVKSSRPAPVWQPRAEERRLA
jgi:hypothetical protein